MHNSKFKMHNEANKNPLHAGVFISLTVH